MAQYPKRKRPGDEPVHKIRRVRPGSNPTPKEVIPCTNVESTHSDMRHIFSFGAGIVAVMFGALLLGAIIVALVSGSKP